MGRFFLAVPSVASLAVAVASSSPFFGQDLTPQVVQQISDVYRIKNGLTPAQQKESFDLVISAMAVSGIGTASVPGALAPQLTTPNNSVAVDMKVTDVDANIEKIGNSGGQVLFASYEAQEIRATIPILSIDGIAADPSVLWIRSADVGTTNGIRDRARAPKHSKAAMPRRTSFFVGALTTQGYVSHTANQAISTGIDGSGVRVGVLSDSASPTRVAALIASGDLPADVVVVPGQTGAGADEGTAMMEIVHDIAPGAKLFFATANTGQAGFANNIETLRFVYHCDVIVDDYTYFAEGAFQDGTIANGVNTVVADGALYFSAAANSGNLDSGTSGTWEGDFQNGGPVSGILQSFGNGFYHNFGTTTNPQNYDTLTGTTASGISLKWSDPLAGSNNDYDLFIFDSTGAVLKAASVNTQTGTQDPYEFIGVGSNCGTSTAVGYCPVIGDRIVVVLYNGSPRALRIDTNRGRLSIGTAGSTFGHNAGINTVSTAATYWNSAHTGTKPFTGPPNPIEFFSSDGPRKLFYNPDGTPITPGNLLFATSGGITIAKPDITAADGVYTKTPGFLPFFGTSAAAPHAAAIAALVKSANPSLTNTEIKAILTSTTVDNMAPGQDRDSGYGIVMAAPAVQKAMSP